MDLDCTMIIDILLWKGMIQTLTSYLENGNLNSSTILQIGIQILNIVEYIHSKGYIHADIKGENILLKENDK